MKKYPALPSPVRRLLAAQLLLNLGTAGVMLILNIHLKSDLGYDDADVGRLTSYRFLGVLMLSLPMGLYLRGRALKPFLVLAALTLPASTLVILDGAARHLDGQIALGMFAFGIGLMLTQVSGLPFILRHTRPPLRTEAISLSFATWALPLLACGILVKALKSSWGLGDAAILSGLAAVAVLAVPVLVTVRERAPRTARLPSPRAAWDHYDWPRILTVSAPTFAIAVGAGLTIPFVNLFFYSVFDLDSETFGLLGGAAGLPVLVGFLLNPWVKRRYGYRTAILLFQALAVFFLVLMGLTELLKEVPGMVLVAGACFLLRQPLMNMANPIASELSLSYAGERNRELVSALSAAIWSGSWFVSARVFQGLRAADVPYWGVFLITAILYVVGILLYARLIRLEESRESERRMGIALETHRLQCPVPDEPKREGIAP